jgi:hypothetical protein
MDGAKLIPASEIYAGIGTAKAPLVVDAPRAAVNANHGMIIGAVLCPPDYIALWSRHRHPEPAGRALRAAFDRSNVAHS